MERLNRIGKSKNKEDFEMKTEEDIKNKLIRVKDVHKYGTDEKTHAYILQEGFITALEWVLGEEE